MEYKQVDLKTDHNAHNTIIEWWYFNGHLTDKNGNRYSFMNCLFRTDLSKVELPFLRMIPFRKYATWLLPFAHFAHSVLSDIGNQKNYKEVQNISLLSRDSFRKPNLFVRYSDPLAMRKRFISEIAQTGATSFHLKTKNLDLELESKKPVLLAGGKGFIDLCGRKTHYYSLTDLRAKGTIKIGDKTIEVEGKAWMDHQWHQWADIAFSKDKWTWFSFQLENGLDILCARYDRDKDKSYMAEMIDSKGTAEHFKRLVVTPGKELWKSKDTQSEYPLDWEIKIPDKNIEIVARSTIRDQEIIFGNIKYWECPLDVTAVIDGKKVKGAGFTELVGYPSKYSFILLALKELQKKLSKKIFHR